MRCLCGREEDSSEESDMEDSGQTELSAAAKGKHDLLLKTDAVSTLALLLLCIWYCLFVLLEDLKWRVCVCEQGGRGGGFFKHTKKSQAMFPFTEEKVKWDDYGELIT